MRTLLAGLSLAAAAAAQPLEFVIHSGPESRLSLTIEKTGFLRGKKHLFVYEQFDGKLVYDAQRPENSKVSLTIEAGKVALMDDWVKPKDQQKIVELARKEMTLAGKHPRMTFSSSRIAKGQGEQYEVDGELTIRGIARPVRVLVSVKPDSGGALWLEGTASVKLTDYRIKPPSAVLGTIGTRDEMTVSFSLRAAPGS